MAKPRRWHRRRRQQALKLRHDLMLSAGMTLRQWREGEKISSTYRFVWVLPCAEHYDVPGADCAGMLPVMISFN